MSYMNFSDLAGYKYLINYFYHVNRYDRLGLMFCTIKNVFCFVNNKSSVLRVLGVKLLFLKYV